MWGGLAFALLNSGRVTDAIKGFQKALSLDPGHADLHVGLGNALRQFGDLAGALDSYGQAVVLRPDYAEVYTNLGNVAIELGDLDQAVGHHRRAAELKSDLAQAYHNLGATYHTARDYEKAAEAFSEARKRDPDNFDTWSPSAPCSRNWSAWRKALNACAGPTPSGQAIPAVPR